METVFNNYLQQNITLEAGDIICPKCKGKRENNQYTTPYKNHIEICCRKCYGNGKLDWIEQIVGVKKPKRIEILDEFTKLAAEQLVKKIDEEIIASLSLINKS